MYEKLRNRLIKIVWKDDGRDKAIVGVLKDIEDTCLGLETRDNKTFVISRDSVVSVLEMEE